MVALSESERRERLATLAEIEGFPSTDALLEAAAIDSVCPSICINPDCSYTEEMEPDQAEGWCEVCATNTMQSALVLAALI